MSRVLLVATTTGYQTRAFEAAAGRLDVQLVYATDRCENLDDPWRDAAIPVRFHRLDESIEAIRRAAASRPIRGVVALGDRPAVLGAAAADALGLEGNPPHAAAAAGSKLLSRGCFMAAGLPVPAFFSMPLGTRLDEVADRVRFPCVLKPLALSASRGVIRADSVDEFLAAQARIERLLRSSEIRALRDTAHDEILVEDFVPGHEFALEGVLEHGMLRVFAIFDKPDPLDGPFFEETIYVTPPVMSWDAQRAIAGTVAHAAAALGLRHGPVHAECRVNAEGVFVLEVAARPIGGLCARALRFVSEGRSDITLEELLLRHALGEPLAGYGREPAASGVMMIPIPGEVEGRRRPDGTGPPGLSPGSAGRYRGVDGADAARAVPGVDDVVITAKPGQMLARLPEASSYVGFIFARGSSAEQVTAALRDAHGCLAFRFDASVSLTPG